MLNQKKNKPKPQRNRQPKRPTPPPPNPRPPKKPRSTISRALISKICGLSDPFCAHAKGAKYPDESSMRTLASTHKYRASLTADANGYVNLLFMPQSQYFAHTSASAYVGTAVTAWNDFTANTVASGIQSYRIVSAGLILRRTSPSLTTSGMVFIRHYPATVAATLTNVDTTTYNASVTQQLALLDCKELPIILAHNSVPAQTFFPASGETAVVLNAGPKGYNIITIGVSGAPANTVVLDMEVVIHYELVFDDSTGLQQFATPAPVFSPILKSATSAVTSAIAGYVGNTVDAASRYVTSRAARYVAEHLGPEAALLALTI